MKHKRRTVLFLPALLLGAAALAGCSGYWEYRQAMQRMEKLAAEQAQAYLQETYGLPGELGEIEVGTYQAGFSSYVDTDALVTVTVGEETFQVYAETAEPSFCWDNRGGLALARDLDLYFRGLYALPRAREQSIRIYSGGEDFFAARTTHLAHGHSFLDFDYHGQPLEEVLPLLDEIAFSYDYLDDSVSLDRAELRDEDWGGSRARVRAQIRCFRTYRKDAPVPLGIALAEDRPVLMAEEMQFSRRGQDYGTLDQIAEALPAFALRETLAWREGETRHARYEATPMGNFWVSTREGLSAAECFTLTADAPDWTGESEGIGNSLGCYYTREELRDGSELTKTDRRMLGPFAEAGFRQAGEMLLPREGAIERMDAWSKREKPSWDHSNIPPVQVMIRPSLVYGTKEQMGAGLLWHREEKKKKIVQLFTSYRDQKTRWTHGLANLAFSFPGTVEGIALVQVE